jgi:hypothetical protein
MGEPEQADVIVEHNSVLIVHIKKSNYTEILIFDKDKNQLIENEKNLRYRVLSNKLFVPDTSAYEKHESFEPDNKRAVLDSAIVGKEFFFRMKVLAPTQSLDSIEHRYKHSYLGSIRNRQGQQLKFLKTIFDWYYVHNGTVHSRGSLDIYDENNVRLGYYGFWSSAELPSHLSGNSIVFTFNNEGCDRKTVISFYDSIPKMMRPYCKGNSIIEVPYSKELE